LYIKGPKPDKVGNFGTGHAQWPFGEFPKLKMVDKVVAETRPSNFTYRLRNSVHSVHGHVLDAAAARTDPDPYGRHRRADGEHPTVPHNSRSVVVVGEFVSAYDKKSARRLRTDHRQTAPQRHAGLSA
jgi:hypothetical protein